MRRLAGKRRTDLGFTLAELVVVLVILGLLVALAFASYVTSVRYVNRTICDTNQRQLTRAVDMYMSERDGSVPATLEELRPFVSNFDTASKCPEDQRSLEYSDEEKAVICTYPGH